MNAPSNFAPMMPIVAQRLLGEPKQIKDGELRWGNKGSLSIDLAKGAWFDHEADNGGGVLDLIRRERGCDKGGALDWLKGEGLLRDDNSAGPIFYDYRDESGAVRYRVERRGAGANRKFLQHGPDGRGGFVCGKGCMDGMARLPYRLPELLASIGPVFVTEGEKDADRLASLGLVATCNSGGAGKFGANLAPYFDGRRVVILQDNDNAGREHARDVMRKLAGVADCTILALPGLPAKGDVSDWLDAGGTVAGLLELGEAALDAPAHDPDTGEVYGDEGKPLLQDSCAFCAARKPADYLINGSVRDGWLYTLTAPTGHGKTAVVLTVTYAIAKGFDLGSNEVKQGHVLFLAGENADDVRERWIAMCERNDDDPASLPVTFMPGVHDLKASLSALRTHFEKTPLRLVIVDTLAAFFDGDNENDNAQQQEFATRVLRPLTELPGRPAVLVPAHPTKGASKDSLTPKGGSSLLNAVDGNLSAWNTDGTVKVHWQGKFRGAPWSPMHFELSEHKSDRLRDRKGRLMPTVVARAMLDSEIGSATEQAVKVENQVLKLLNDGLTIRDIADDVVANGKRGVSKSRVDRVIQRMAETKWIIKSGRRWKLTQQGFDVLKQAGEEADVDV